MNFHGTKPVFNFIGLVLSAREAMSNEKLFEMLDLPSVTLVTITGVRPDEANEALMVSMRDINFAQVLMLSSEPPRQKNANISYIPIPPMTLREYSVFVLKQLSNHVATEYCLIVQEDGFVVDVGMWREEFLRYDYIGAPWPHVLNGGGPGGTRLKGGRVGNGGFSLRSKRLIDATANSAFDIGNVPMLVEDMIVCEYKSMELVEQGISFAPVETACLFSLECPVPEHNGIAEPPTFGFHGKHLLERMKQRVHL